MSGSGPVMAGDAALTFTALQGTVIGTDQRSDSYTSGSGRTIVVDGSGGGTSSLSTEIVVSRDIWVKDRSGREHHVRITADVPVRTGQDIAVITCRGEVAMPQGPVHGADGLIAVYVLPTNTAYPVLPLADLAGQLAARPLGAAAKIRAAAAWLVSLLLVPVFAIGIGLLAILIIRAALKGKRRRARQQVIQSGMQAGYQRLLDMLHAEYGARLVAEGKETQPQLQSGGANLV